MVPILRARCAHWPLTSKIDLLELRPSLLFFVWSGLRSTHAFLVEHLSGLPRFCEDDGCHYVVPRIVLYLLRPAEKGDELFVDYGEDTAKRFLLASPEHQGPMKLGSSPFEERFVYARRARDISAADNGGVEVSYQPMSSMHAVALLPGENVGGVTESASVMVSIIIRVQLNFILILFSGCGSRIRVRRRD